MQTMSKTKGLNCHMCKINIEPYKDFIFSIRMDIPAREYRTYSGFAFPYCHECFIKMVGGDFIDDLNLHGVAI